MVRSLFFNCNGFFIDITDSTLKTVIARIEDTKTGITKIDVLYFALLFMLYTLAWTHLG